MISTHCFPFRFWAGIFLLLTFNACVKHDAPLATLEPITAFSGRLLVMNQAHRFQVEADWQGDAKQGTLRLTHASTGRIVDVSWLDNTMMWRDNQQILIWQPLSEAELLQMGIVLPPWTLATLLLGDYPSSMRSKDQRTWQGVWHDIRLKIRWAPNQERVEITNMLQGQRLVIIFNTINHAS